MAIEPKSLSKSSENPNTFYGLKIYILSEMTDDTLGLSTGKCKYDKKNFSNMNSKINSSKLVDYNYKVLSILKP